MNTTSSHNSRHERFPGIVRWVNVNQGFGFIEISAALKADLKIPSDKDLFFHVSAAREQREVRPGDQVEFEIRHHVTRGPRAHDLIVTGHAPQTQPHHD